MTYEVTDFGDLADADLASLFARPFDLARPAEQRVPFIFASPHSGRLYPQSFVAASRLDAVTLRRSEDAFVEELFADVVGLGAPLLAARFPRAFVDVNRAPTELDVMMFDGPLGVGVEAPAARVNAGLGVIPRIVRDGAEIYRRRLPAEEAATRLHCLYRPYHTALSALIEETRARFGVAIVIDCHSMPSGTAIPDIVMGDRFGVAASPQVTRQAETGFERAGFTVGRNAPYAGGYTTQLYGRRDAQVHALQIEISRGLYLDEAHIVHGPGFETVRAQLAAALEILVALDIDLLERTRPCAAE